MNSPLKRDKLPLISIVTPSYNQGAFLEEAIKSVIFQNYANVEYIIIDGGSTDESLDIIHKYESRISYWQSKPDKGQANAINIGFKRAKGEILAWLNADDVYMPGTLQHIADKFIHFPSTEIIYGDCVFIDEKGNFIRYFTECEDYDKYRLLNFSNFIMQPTTFFTRNKLFEIGLLDENLFYAMDWDLWCSFSEKNAKFKYLPRVLAANRVYSNTKTYSGGNDRLREIWRVQKRHITGIWPHAFWGIAATEIYQRGERSQKRLNKIFLKLFGRTLSVLSPQSKIYSWRNRSRKKVRYGFYPHSTLCFGKARIFLPIFREESIKAIEIEVGIDGVSELRNNVTHVSFKLCGVLCKTIILSNSMQTKKEIIPFEQSFKRENKLLFEIIFKNDAGNSKKGYIHNISFIQTGQ